MAQTCRPRVLRTYCTALWGTSCTVPSAWRRMVTFAMTLSRALGRQLMRLPSPYSTYAEASAFWIDEATGELCKCRPDWTAPAGDGVILVDGKTCIDASPEGFARAIVNFGYHRAAAWYSDGYEQASGKPVYGYVFACAESAYPHAAAAYMLGDEDLERSRAHNRVMLNLYAECKRTGVWPGYPPGVQLIELPKWAR